MRPDHNPYDLNLLSIGGQTIDRHYPSLAFKSLRERRQRKRGMLRPAVLEPKNHDGEIRGFANDLKIGLQRR